MSDFTSGAKPSVDFTKPLQCEFVSFHTGVGVSAWGDVVYIGPYKNKYVVADTDGQYHTVNKTMLRNKPVKPTTKQLYDYCVQAALIEGFGWANQAAIIELIYQHLVLNELVKEES